MITNNQGKQKNVFKFLHIFPFEKLTSTTNAGIYFENVYRYNPIYNHKLGYT